jgi:hypothetical protein
MTSESLLEPFGKASCCWWPSHCSHWVPPFDDCPFYAAITKYLILENVQRKEAYLTTNFRGCKCKQHGTSSGEGFMADGRNMHEGNGHKAREWGGTSPALL